MPSYSGSRSLLGLRHLDRPLPLKMMALWSVVASGTFGFECWEVLDCHTFKMLETALSVT